MAYNNPLEDASSVQTTLVSQEAIEDDRVDAIRYLKRKNALDLIPDLGLGEYEYAG